MIRRILAIRNDRFGEFLLIIPALRALKESFPEVKITLVVNPYVKELAGCVEYADEVITWDNQRHRLREVFGFSAKLKKKKFDLAVIFNPSKEAHLVSFLARIPKRVGYNRKWGILLTHKLKDTKYLGNRHEVDCNLELVGLVGAKTQDKSVAIKVDENLFSEFLGQKIVAIHPFTSDAVKQWPIERFKELAQRIRCELGLKVIMVGLSQDTLDVDGNIINMINKTSLVELAALLKRCCLLVSGDSGPMHLAAAVGTPVIALFRNDLPGKTARRWGPWGKGHTVIEKSKLEDISVDEVVRVIKDKLHGQVGL